MVLAKARVGGAGDMVGGDTIREGGDMVGDVVGGGTLRWVSSR